MAEEQKVIHLYPHREQNLIASRLTTKILDKRGIDPLIPNLPQRVLEALSQQLRDPNWMTR